MDLKSIITTNRYFTLTASAVFFNVAVVQMSMVDDASLVLSVGAEVDTASDGESEESICSVALEEVFSIVVVCTDVVCHKFDKGSFQLFVQWQAGI